MKGDAYAEVRHEADEQAEVEDRDQACEAGGKAREEGQVTVPEPLLGFVPDWEASQSGVFKAGERSYSEQPNAGRPMRDSRRDGI